MWARVHAGPEGEKVTTEDLQMKAASWRSYLLGVGAFLLSYGFALFWCGMMMHELGHALAARIFGLPHHLVPWIHTLILRNPFTPSWAYNLVALAGGITQSLTALGFLCWVSVLQKALADKGVFKEKIFFAVKLAFLTVAFTGFIVLVWEGVFTYSYLKFADEVVLWDLVNLVCGLLAFRLLYQQSMRKH